ncbi:MAG: transposase [Cyclobacteriaceae bacterium]
MDTRPDTMKNIASYYGINAQKLQRHYKHQVSGYPQWDQQSHAHEYLIYPDNITGHLSIDELSLSKGELYTFVTNKNTGMKNKKSVVAIINGTKAKVIEEVLKKISVEKRGIVKEVTMDMARNMACAVDTCFPNSTKVIDRFHAVKLVMDAMQHVRVKLRWQAIDDENTAVKEAKQNGEKYQPKILSNGDTIKELLARSRYLLYSLEENWTVTQANRAAILFEKYPILETAYKLTLIFRSIYKNLSKQKALMHFVQWKKKVIESKIEQFNTVVNSLEYHLENILNFFDNRSTNANAESFNSKIKGFRANLRGVTDVEFFLFRLEKLFA